jgi:hypothetical protein
MKVQAGGTLRVLRDFPHFSAVTLSDERSEWRQRVRPLGGDNVLTAIHRSALSACGLGRFWPKVNIREIEVTPYNKAIQADG